MSEFSGDGGLLYELDFLFGLDDHFRRTGDDLSSAVTSAHLVHSSFEGLPEERRTAR